MDVPSGAGAEPALSRSEILTRLTSSPPAPPLVEGPTEPLPRSSAVPPTIEPIGESGGREEAAAPGAPAPGLEERMGARWSVWIGEPQPSLLLYLFLLQAAVLAGCVVLRLLLNPAVLAYPVGGWLIFNSILLAYGIAALAFAGAAYLFARTGQTRLRDALGVGSVILGLALISLEIRNGFHPSLPATAPIGTTEGVAYGIAWSLYGWVLLDGRVRRLLPLLGTAGLAIGWIGVLEVVAVAALVRNPLWTHESVGAGLVVNRLLYLYLLGCVPALLLAAGIAAGSRTLRLAALVIMSAAVLKVFLFDTSHLKNLYRVLSFLGLGASLVALGWLYQRFVIGSRANEGARAGA